MTKFRTLLLALTYILAIGLASCAPAASPDVAPQQTSVESPAPPQTDLTTPQPIQVIITDLLDNAPPAFMPGTLASHKLPRDAQAVTADAYPTLASSLRAYGLVPVMDEGIYVYQGGENSYLPVLEQLPYPGGLEIKQQGLNNGVVRYQGFATDGRLVQQYFVAVVPCGDGNVCVTAVSTHEKDAGVLYAIELDSETGEVVGAMPLVHNESPRINEYGVTVLGADVTMSEPPAHWMSTVSGEDALWRQPVQAMTYGPAEALNGEMVMTFQVGEVTYSAIHDEIYHNPDIGTYVANASGLFVYDSDNSSWYSPEIVTATDGSQTLQVGSRQVVQVESELHEVVGESEFGSRRVVKTEGGDKLVWENGQWVELNLGIDSGQLALMDESAKISIAKQYASEYAGKTGFNDNPEVDGGLVTWKKSENYTALTGGTKTREVIDFAWDLASGELIERVTFDELPDLWDSIEDGEQVFFDGELLTMTTIKDGPLVDAMNVVMSNGEHLGPNDVFALVDTNGEVKVVEFQYVPNNPASEIMSVVKAEAGNGQTLYVVQPLGTEGKFVFDGKDPVTKAEISSWFPPLKMYGGNQVLNNAIDTPGSTFVVVTADPANYPGGWAGVKGDVARFTADGSHGFTADQRGEVGDNPVIVLTKLAKPEFLKKGEGYRIVVNWGDGKAVGNPILAAFMAGAQNPSSPDNLEFGYTKYAETGYFYRPYEQGLWWELFE